MTIAASPAPRRKPILAALGVFALAYVGLKLAAVAITLALGFQVGAGGGIAVAVAAATIAARWYVARTLRELALGETWMLVLGSLGFLMALAVGLLVLLSQAAGSIAETGPTGATLAEAPSGVLAGAITFVILMHLLGFWIAYGPIANARARKLASIAQNRGSRSSNTGGGT